MIERKERKDYDIDRFHKMLDLIGRDPVIAWLDNLSEEEKHDRLMLPWEPSIPETEEDRAEWIDAWGSYYTDDEEYLTDEWIEEYREGLLEELRSGENALALQDLEIDEDTPTKDLAEAIKSKFRTWEPEELLRAGVFGTVRTEDYAERMKEEQIEWALLNIVTAQLDIRKSEHLGEALTQDEEDNIVWAKENFGEELLLLDKGRMMKWQRFPWESIVRTIRKKKELRLSKKSRDGKKIPIR